MIVRRPLSPSVPSGIAPRVACRRDIPSDKITIRARAGGPVQTEGITDGKGHRTPRQRVEPPHRRGRPPDPAQRPARRPGPDRRQVRLRRGPLRRLHRAGRRPAGPLLPRPRRAPSRASRSRPSRAWRRTGKLHPLQQAFLDARRHAVRLLHARHDHGRRRRCWPRTPDPERRRDRRGDGRQRLPVRDLPPHRRRDPPRGQPSTKGGAR